MQKLIIYNSEIYNFKKLEMQKGGVLTYIKDLAKLGQEMCNNVVMYQYENSHPAERSYDWNGIQIRDVYVNAKGHKLIQRGFDEVYRRENGDGVVFVVSTDQLDVRSKSHNVIQIQHGIAFDIPADWIPNTLVTSLIGKMVNKLMRCIRNVNRLNNVPHTVCVDYNYYNWYRTIGSETQDRMMVVIPNYTSDRITYEELNSKLAQRTQIKKVVFARRMVDHRGSLLFANVAKRLLDERDDVEFTFSGDGPCLPEMKKLLGNYKQVSFTEYKSEDSVSFHSQFDICVVPTIFSEGTSLSLIEGMAAGCLPLSTHVGGLTNILLDGYNGFLTHPDEDSFYRKLKYILDLDAAYFDLITRNAYSVATSAFFIDKWKNDWMAVLKNI